MKRTLKKGICIATAAMMVAGMTSVTALADDTKASGKINFITGMQIRQMK